MKQLLFCSILFLFSFSAVAQVAPLPVDQDTIALWNFNLDPNVDTVTDSGPLHIDGMAQAAAFATLGTLQRGRQFTGTTSSINFGLLTPSHPLNLENESEWSIEFVVFPVASTFGRKTVFDNGRLKVELHDQKIETSIFWNGVWRGVTTDKTLNLQTFYRVSVIFAEEESQLGIKVNNATWASIKLEPAKKKLQKKLAYGHPILIGGTPREEIATMSVGQEHACLITNAGDLMCWGANYNGQIGNGSNLNSSLPVFISKVKNPTKVSTGHAHTCAITNSKTYCWGLNFRNALGVATLNMSNTPVEVATVPAATDIASGEAHSCVITTGKKLNCWGQNNYGQLGLGFFSDSALPTEVPGLSNIKQVSLGRYHSCAVDEAGSVYCWGFNGRGQTGYSLDVAPIPWPVPNLSGVVKVETGNYHTCALLNTNQVKCWGANDSGQLGNGGTTDSVVPTLVSNLASDIITDVGVGLGDHSCVLVRPNSTSGNLKCWGKNDYQQIGQANQQQIFTTPVLAPSSNLASEMQVGGNGNCFKFFSGIYVCFGSNLYGVLGSDTSVASSVSPQIVWATRLASSNAILDDIRISNTARLSIKKPVITLTAPTSTSSTDFPQISFSVQTDLPLNPNSIIALLNGDSVSGLSVSGTTISGTMNVPLNFGENDFSLKIEDVNGNVGTFYGKLTYSPLLNPALPAKIAVGANNACYLTGEGSLWCWGMNTFGQLGEETFARSSSPVKNRFVNSAKDIVIGYSSMCGIYRDDSVFCWGNNNSGQLGHQDFDFRKTTIPQLIPLTKPYSKLIAGNEMYCAVNTDGTVTCWGENNNNVLGFELSYRDQPTEYPYISNVTDMSLSDSHACFIKTDGTLWCSGLNSWGQLGRGTLTQYESIGMVPGLFNVKKVTTGYLSTCAIANGDKLYCWGSNESLQVGSGTSLPKRVLSPSQVPFIQSATIVTQTDSSTCTLNSFGSLNCWGLNTKGEIGNGSFDPAPNGYSQNEVFLDVDSRFGTICSLNNSQQVKCWGVNNVGQAGVEQPIYVNVPTEVIPHSVVSRNLSSLASGLANTCLKINNETNCWGSNEQYQLGFADFTFQELSPVKISGFENSLQTSIGYGLICHVTPTKQAYCGGFNNFGQAGASPGQYVYPPALIPLENVIQVEAGLDSSCALLSSGTVWCWGNGSQGQLGTGGYASNYIPAQVTGLNDVKKIGLAERGQHACALKNDNSLWCWGLNDNSQLAGNFGGNATPNSPVAVKAFGSTNVTDFSLGAFHTCILAIDKNVYCVGSNTYGQLGIGSYVRNVDVKRVNNLRNVVGLAAGEFHTCAITTDKNLYCWGRNNYGQVGNDSLENTPTGIKVLTSVDEIALGSFHSCAIAEGILSCWGNNAQGIFGDGTQVSSLVPQYSVLKKK